MHPVGLGECFLRTPGSRSCHLPWQLTPASYWRPTTKPSLIRACAVRNGNDRQLDQGEDASVEMAVAAGVDAALPAKRQVPPPRREGSLRQPTLLPIMQSMQGVSRAQRAKLGAAGVELAVLRSNLQRSDMQLRHKDRELARMKAALADQHTQLRAVSMQLQDALAQLSDKEGELQTAYSRLAAASRERGEIRSALLASQREVLDVRSELAANMQEALPAPMPGGSDEMPAAKAVESNGADPAPRDAMSTGEGEKMLRDLAELSRQLIRDAAEDSSAFTSQVAPSS